MAQNNQNPKTKVNPLNVGLGLEGLKGYDPQNQTQEIKKESQVYTVTKNDGTQEDKSYDELSTPEKKAVATTGIVEGGKTDIEKQYSVAAGSVGVKPTRLETTGSGLGTLSGIATATALGAKSGGTVGALIGGGMAIINAGAAAAEKNQKYQDALREFDEKVADNSVVAGSWEEDDEGNLIFMPDYSKVGKDISISGSGAKIANLFKLDDNTDPEVYFDDDGVLNIDINRAFADTEEYQNIVNSVSSDYAGLTKDTTDVDTYLKDIKQRFSSALDQYRFEVNRVAAYRNKLPDASIDTIMDAARGEIGAVLSDSDKKDWPVKVYRDGNVVETNAQEVLDNVYNMGDKSKRNEYIEKLADLLENDSISDDQKAYVLSEYNLLFSASDADVKEGKEGEDRKKYAEMLDQDFLVTVLKSSGIVRGLDSLVDSVAGFVSQGQTNDILIANQDYLTPEEGASNFGAVVGSAFDVYVTQKIMQGVEQKAIRPTLGAASRGVGKALVATDSEVLGNVGKKMIEASWKAVTNRAGDVVRYRTALDINGVKNAALTNVIKAFGSGDSGLSYRLLAKGAGELMAWSVGELSINFASDALFDAAKLSTAVLSGDIKNGEEAQQYMADALGQDLMLDLVIQYGPQGMLDIQTTKDAIRLQKIEPYAQGVAKARADYGEALSAVEDAKANKTSAKKMKELESDVLAKKNALTKAETDYADARKQWIGSGSQKFGAKLAEIESRMTEAQMYRKFQEAMVDENAAGTALVRAAYYASGGDVELFNKLMNTASNNLRTLTRITANELASDRWAKGTGDALNLFKKTYSDIAGYTGKLSKADVDYLKARNELNRYIEAAQGDKKKIADAERNYSKYIDAVSPERAAKLDELLGTMGEVVNKTNESAINAGIQTEEDIQTKRNATGFQKHGYVPMYLKRKNKNSHYVIGQERNLDHTWDRGEFWDLDNLEDPVLNTLTYVNYTARNIAVNERNKAIIAATEIPGMRTHRTDVDNEIIRTDDGNVYKRSNIIEHMDAKAEKRLKKISDVKKEAPTELEFSDEKDKILYGKSDGSHKSLVEELSNFKKTEGEGSSSSSLGDLQAENKGLRNQLKKQLRQIKQSKKSASKTKTLDIFELSNKIKANEEAQTNAKEDLRTEVYRRIDALKQYYNDTYSKFGYTTSVRVSRSKIDGFIETGDMEGLATYLEDIKDRASLARPTDQELTNAVFEKQVTGLEIELRRSMNKNFPGLSNEQKKDVYARVLGGFRRKAMESGDVTAQQVAEEAYARNVGYPITYYDGGEEKVAYIDGPLAKPVYEMCVRSENVTDRNFLQKAFEGAAKLKRYATTAIDVTRALPNLLRDALRGDIMSGGTDYAGARKLFTEILEAEGLTDEQKNKAMGSIELAIRVAQGETLNAAIENRTEKGLQDMVRETRQEGKNMVSRIIWDVAHGRIGHALETPMNVAEMYTRRRMAQSAYVREFKDSKYTSSTFDERLDKAYHAGLNAGMENTTNFSRRGSAVGAIARYVPYFQQNFANIESANNAFLKDPAGVSARAAIFSYAYVMMLAETLKKEETRRAYYNLSDYDRKNNIVFSLDGNTLVTIPLDESLASMITPWRRTLETINGIDPGTFSSIFTDTLLDLSPLDLDGFTEGDGLNVRRGIEKLTSQAAPSLATGLIQTITGYNLYYGSSNAVTDASLAESGQVAESAGDYTTPGANSKILRQVADATGIPQWQLQQVVANFGGNVGQYVLNTLDKLAGASKDEQGGKDFVDSVFKSMTGTDSQNVKNQFYTGIDALKKERTKVVKKLEDVKEEISTATGTELADLKKKYQEIKDNYGQKVSDFVNQYLSAYEITGGLEEKQASQIYYLFNLYDDDTVYEPGSVGEYHQNLARQQAYNEADSWAAPVLDKYYDQTRNVYKDASGTWHYSSPYGEQAYYNTIYGKGMKYQVGLRNLIEGVTSNLKDARSKAYEDRSAAMDRKDYDAYDQIGADFDAQVVKVITPYINEYGAENVLNNSSVMDYLEEWFFVPSSYMKTKKNRYVPSLAHDASKQRAFVRPYIKSLYNVDTGYVENKRESLLNPEVF